MVHRYSGRQASRGQVWIVHCYAICICPILWRDYPFKMELRSKISRLLLLLLFLLHRMEKNKRHGKKSPLIHKNGIWSLLLTMHFITQCQKQVTDFIWERNNNLWPQISPETPYNLLFRKHFGIILLSSHDTPIRFPLDNLQKKKLKYKMFFFFNMKRKIFRVLST